MPVISRQKLRSTTSPCKIWGKNWSVCSGACSLLAFLQRQCFLGTVLINRMRVQRRATVALSNSQAARDDLFDFADGDDAVSILIAFSYPNLLILMGFHS